MAAYHSDNSSGVVLVGVSNVRHFKFFQLLQFWPQLFLKVKMVETGKVLLALNIS